MKCCGKDRQTAFCADCGATLHTNTAHEIQHFITGKRENLLSVQRQYVVWDAEYPEKAKERSRLRRRQALQRKVDRFTRWIEFLAKHLD